MIDQRNMKPFSVMATTLKHVALVPEVETALLAWVRATLAGHNQPGVLIGGLALSFYAKPRTTMDIDLLFLHPDDVPAGTVVGFKRIRTHAFEEHRTHVEIDVCTSQSIGIPQEVVRMVWKTAVVHEGIRVASREGMIALKLYGAQMRKRELKDLADVVAMLETDSTTDMTDWKLTDMQRKQLEDCRSRATSI